MVPLSLETGNPQLESGHGVLRVRKVTPPPPPPPSGVVLLDSRA